MTETKKVQKFQQRDFGAVQFKFNRWSLELTEAQTLDDVFDGSAWTHLVPIINGHDRQRGRGDIIEIRKLDTGLYAEVMIQEIGPGGVRVAPIRAFEPKGIEIPEDVPFEVRWNVGKRKHEVVRRTDKAVMAGDFQSKESAAAWIVNHMQATSSKAA